MVPLNLVVVTNDDPRTGNRRTSPAVFAGRKLRIEMSVDIGYLDDEGRIEPHALVRVTPRIADEAGSTAMEIHWPVRMSGQDVIGLGRERYFGNVGCCEKRTFVDRIGPPPMSSRGGPGGGLAHREDEPTQLRKNCATGGEGKVLPGGESASTAHGSNGCACGRASDRRPRASRPAAGPAQKRIVRPKGCPR